MSQHKTKVSKNFSKNVLCYKKKYFTILFKIIQHNLAVSVQSPTDSKYIQVISHIQWWVNEQIVLLIQLINLDLVESSQLITIQNSSIISFITKLDSLLWRIVHYLYIFERKFPEHLWLKYIPEYSCHFINICSKQVNNVYFLEHSTKFCPTCM